MGDMLIRNVSDAMKRDIAARAERNGRSLSDETKALIQKAMMITGTENSLERPALDGLREVFLPLTPEERDEFSEIMEEVEAERKKDFGRPVEGFE
jgi:antitoxin FitA